MSETGFTGISKVNSQNANRALVRNCIWRSAVVQKVEEYENASYTAVFRTNQMLGLIPTHLPVPPIAHALQLAAIQSLYFSTTPLPRLCSRSTHSGILLWYTCASLWGSKRRIRSKRQIKIPLVPSFVRSPYPHLHSSHLIALGTRTIPSFTYTQDLG